MARELRLDPKLTQIAADAFVALNAIVVGDVHVGSESSVWFGVVIRGDVESVRIGARTNIQDNSVLHADAGFPCLIGHGVTVGHRSIVHGARVGDNVLIGMGATVMNGAVIGADSIVGANALITEGKEIPPRSLVMGVPARIVRELTDEEVAGIRLSAEHYVLNGRAYKAAGYESQSSPK
jgi:carbonic anhydrase/acetyltransferase-like protein (isoleucine patch superfamily)